MIVLSAIQYARKAPYTDRAQPAVENLKKWLAENSRHISEHNPFGFEVIYDNPEYQVIHQNDEGFYVENEGTHFHLFLISKHSKEVLLCDASPVTESLELQRQAKGMVRIWEKNHKN